MTVRSVWGRIQRRNAVLIRKDGDKWVFQVPPWAVSPLIVEFWAEDDAGNVSYKTGIFDLEEGRIKCIRWLNEGSNLVMLPDDRPSICMMHDDRPQADMLGVLTITALAEDRPSIEMLDHACPRLTEVTI